MSIQLEKGCSPPVTVGDTHHSEMNGTAPMSVVYECVRGCSSRASVSPFLSDHNKGLFEWNHRDAASHDSVGVCVCVAKLEGSAQTRESEPFIWRYGRARVPTATASGLTPMAYARSSPNILIYTPTSNFARPPTHQMMGYRVPPH